MSKRYTLFTPPYVIKNNVVSFSIKTYVVGTQKNRHNEMVLFEDPKHIICYSVLISTYKHVMIIMYIISWISTKV